MILLAMFRRNEERNVKGKQNKIYHFYVTRINVGKACAHKKLTLSRVHARNYGSAKSSKRLIIKSNGIDKVSH